MLKQSRLGAQFIPIAEENAASKGNQVTNSTQEEHSQLHPQFRCTILCIEQLGGLCLRTNVDPQILLSSTFCNSL